MHDKKSMEASGRDMAVSPGQEGRGRSKLCNGWAKSEETKTAGRGLLGRYARDRQGPQIAAVVDDVDRAVGQEDGFDLIDAVVVDDRIGPALHRRNTFRER